MATKAGAPAPGGRRRRGPKIGEGFRIGGRISRLDALVTGILAFGGVVALWYLATSAELVEPFFLPSPTTVADRFLESLTSGQLWDDISVSVVRIMIAFAIASVMAIPVGVLIAAFRRPEAAIEPLVNFARYLPVTALVPLTIVWSGTSELQKWLIIWLGTFFQQVLIIKDDIKRTPLELVDIGRTFGMSELRILGSIVVPNGLPRIWDTLRITLGWAWTWVVLAELSGATSGLGYRTTVGQRYFETDLIISYVLVVGVLGLITDQMMKLIGNRLFGWAEARR